jgi:Arc/MetJ family transcription regulator
MRKKVEIEIDDDLVQEAIRRYHLADAREAVHLALRTLLGETEEAGSEQQDDEYDQFSDLSAWEPHRRSDTG